MFFVFGHGVKIFKKSNCVFECFYQVIKGKLNTYEIEKNWLPLSDSWLSERPKSCIQELFSLIFDNFSRIKYWFHFHFFLHKLHPKNKTPKRRFVREICFLIVIPKAWESKFSKNGDGFLLRINNQTPVSASLEAWVHLSNPPRKCFHLRNRIQLKKLPFPILHQFFEKPHFLEIANSKDQTW